MVFNSSDKLPLESIKENYIFLAGSMDLNTTNNWRRKVITTLQPTYSLLDPTNMNHANLDNSEMIKHINWELDALHMSDIILLNFLPNALSPISLVELGLYVSTKKLIVVCPKEFYQSNYVYTLCKKYTTPIFFTLEEALNTLTLN